MRLAVYFLVLTHVIACLWFGLMTDVSINPPPNWFTNQYTDSNELLDNYAMCFYAALAMFSGEDIEPTTSAERVFAITTLFSGTVALAVIVGQITVLLQNFDMGRNRYQEKMKVGWGGGGERERKQTKKQRKKETTKERNNERKKQRKKERKKERKES